MAFFTIIAQYRAVKLQDSLASGGLMQSIDILRHYSRQLAGLFQLCKSPVRFVRFCVGYIRFFL